MLNCPPCKIPWPGGGTSERDDIEKGQTMNRREFSKGVLMLGVGARIGLGQEGPAGAGSRSADRYEEPVKKLPVRKFDVVVAGGGTGGVVAALGCGPAGGEDRADRGQGLSRRRDGRGRHGPAQLLQPVEGVPRRREAAGGPGDSAGDHRPAAEGRRLLRPRRDGEGLQLRLRSAPPSTRSCTSSRPSRCSSRRACSCPSIRCWSGRSGTARV